MYDMYVNFCLKHVFFEGTCILKPMQCSMLISRFLLMSCGIQVPMCLRMLHAHYKWEKLYPLKQWSYWLISLVTIVFKKRKKYSNFKQKASGHFSLLAPKGDSTSASFRTHHVSHQQEIECRNIAENTGLKSTLMQCSYMLSSCELRQSLYKLQDDAVDGWSSIKH